MKNLNKFRVSLLVLLTLVCMTGCKNKLLAPLQKAVGVNATKTITVTDGFGVNITPVQWRDGNLKSVINMLVDDLGATLFRFDCTGLADWLDPSRRNTEGQWPETYLDSVYKTKVFKDAWATFRYLNSKGVEPFFNVSGRIPPGLGQPTDPKRLADFTGYARMIVSMLRWARDKENLKFSLVAPFNETDLGYPEGPKIEGKDLLLATQVVITELDAAGMKDIKLIAIDDAYPKMDRLEDVLSDTSLVNRLAVFATHTYGNGDIGENEPWFDAETDYARFSKTIKNSSFRNSSVWMTEYGDLDQTGEIGYEFAWRSTRRLMKAFRDGFNAAIAWDAFDNFHEHDTAWAKYGLLNTDTATWTYTPKVRYYAAKQVYRFVKPGWRMVEIITPQPATPDIYRTWHDSFRHIRILAFVSPDGSDYSILIMNGIESDTDLTITLDGISSTALSKSVRHFVTSRSEYCVQHKEAAREGKTINAILPANSISTLTTLQ